MLEEGGGMLLLPLFVRLREELMFPEFKLPVKLPEIEFIPELIVFDMLGKTLLLFPLPGGVNAGNLELLLPVRLFDRLLLVNPFEDRFKPPFKLFSFKIAETSLSPPCIPNRLFVCAMLNPLSVFIVGVLVELYAGNLVGAEYGQFWLELGDFGRTEFDWRDEEFKVWLFNELIDEFRLFP